MNERRRGGPEDPSPFPAAYGPVGEHAEPLWPPSPLVEPPPAPGAADLDGLGDGVQSEQSPTMSSPLDTSSIWVDVPAQTPPGWAPAVAGASGTAFQGGPFQGAAFEGGAPVGGLRRGAGGQAGEGTTQQGAVSAAQWPTVDEASAPTTGVIAPGAVPAALAAQSGSVGDLPPGWSSTAGPTVAQPAAATDLIAASGRPVVQRHLVRRVDAWTVFKVSLVFYLLMLAITLAGGVAAWEVAARLSLIKDIEKLVRNLAVKSSFVLHPLVVLEYAAAIGGILVVVGTLLNTVAALVYNLISDLIGGVQGVVVTATDPPER